MDSSWKICVVDDSVNDNVAVRDNVLLRAFGVISQPRFPMRPD